MIGLLGGAFDPPHIGHIALADAAERQLGLEHVVVVVVADPGHKDVHCPAETRLALARAAFPGRDVELDRHARTVDMLREGRWDDPVFLVGADEFADFLDWKEPEGVLELARLGVASRPGYPRERLEEVLATLGRPERVLFFEIEPVPVSSSEIRERVGRGESVDGLVPAAVAGEIAGRGLYRR
ncbi:MAG TPA: nicotinate-nicotinamide nucleotide adenylyltransferase [Gaiellaceae bacterium]|nr:nicotinate-nicotinamide nucleotide adenylyltransferase [Gaiellaceae bacterium]